MCCLKNLVSGPKVVFCLLLFTFVQSAQNSPWYNRYHRNFIPLMIRFILWNVFLCPFKRNRILFNLHIKNYLKKNTFMHKKKFCSEYFSQNMYIILRNVQQKFWDVFIYIGPNDWLTSREGKKFPTQAFLLTYFFNHLFILFYSYQSFLYPGNQHLFTPTPLKKKNFSFDSNT